MSVKRVGTKCHFLETEQQPSRVKNISLGLVPLVYDVDVPDGGQLAGVEAGVICNPESLK